MNAGIGQQSARSVSASSESPQMMADWLRTTQSPLVPKIDSRQLLMARYPIGLISDAELEALIRILDR
ncbi:MULTISPECIES: hypothetical protein [unclassified Pseudomonas]|uniref:hypothetical protein n=1 Tax=unclassified Pseudomonas TaxID=196821 RepID=UPI002AC9CAC9|nr:MULTISPECIES: hypothetical protein [unclassified Pseudomonas]MEB0042482.1 hypothetical protein [Pseudomonas sp. MH10]MEB0077357.1 hypothetical protein [Pseudomonas sp. MH10out]MEB0092861.1 hypothetical protein [Pseudomonas sp. CCI4.2]MEB0104297.1 hypothetical protein [Pseudomonas sp. CCI3.2]MEB0120535.1 hypothetical protein [Pseudomonas sp. CCI1.2]